MSRGKVHWLHGGHDNYTRGGFRGDATPIADYYYQDEHGQDYLLVTRYERVSSQQFDDAKWDPVKQQWKRKWFPQSHMDPRRQDWARGAPKGPKIPYKLPELIAANPEQLVHIFEGEKDVDNAIAKLGLTATTAAGAFWTKDHSKWFKGRKCVCIHQDNDVKGQAFARQVARSLTHIVPDIRILKYEQLPETSDFSDWLNAGGTAAQLREHYDAAPPYEPMILDPADPIRSARALIAEHFTDFKGLRTLHRHRGAYWTWVEQNNYYQMLKDKDEDLKSDIWLFLEQCYRWERLKKKRGEEEGQLVMVPFKPTTNRVNDVLNALAAISKLDDYINPPQWIIPRDETMPKADELMACGNGLVHLPTGELYPSTPGFFNVNASSVRFDANAPQPTQWLTFLQQLFGDDEEAKQLLQQWYGYNLAPDKSHQKILGIIGPSRSGKGTMASVKAALLGSAADINDNRSVGGPTMRSLSETFGLEPLITKSAAIISDARVDPRKDTSVIVERLLSISGNDVMTVARKFRDAWTGRLPTRIMIVSNELPRLLDASGALANRMLVIKLTKSFLGKEDLGLLNKLIKELPGILNWAITGYRDLHRKGKFVQPKSGQESVTDIEMLGAPVKEFIREHCDIGPAFRQKFNDLWGWFESWCKMNNMDPGYKPLFGRNLIAAEASLTKVKETTGERDVVYTGIRLKPEAIKGMVVDEAAPF